MKRSNLVLILFSIIAFTELMAVMFNLHTTQLLVKPLIMPYLVYYYYMSTEKRSWVFVAALLCCWAGDVLLMFQDSMAYFFMFGLLAFLVGHLLYIVSYRKFQSMDLSHALLPTQKIRYALPFVLAGTGLITVLYPTLGSLRIPVIVYAAVLMGMVIIALLRFGRTTSPSFWLVFVGAVLFMVSDSMLAMNKFHSAIPNAGVLIMMTYIAGQYLIVEGIIRHPGDDR